jgi:hypothetical protein
VNANGKLRVNYHTMTFLAVIAGAFGAVLQLIPDGEILSFMVSLAALGGLIGGGKEYSEQDRRQLGQSYKTAFEWLLLTIMAVYAFILIARWLNAAQSVAIFINSHWPGLTISAMCLLMGIAGLQKLQKENSA